MAALRKRSWIVRIVIAILAAWLSIEVMRDVRAIVTVMSPSSSEQAATWSQIRRGYAERSPAFGDIITLSPAVENEFRMAIMAVLRKEDPKDPAALGAVAFTQGNNIYFQPDPHGSRNPNPDVLAHELTHVVQQRQPGQVAAPQHTFKPE